MWVFLVTEVMFFGGLFLAYFVYRQAYPAAFASASNKTNLLIGAANTTVLICSSLTMALAVHSAALGKKNLIVLFLILTLLLGGTFLGVKAYEYHDKWVHHEVPGHNFDCEGCTDARAHASVFRAVFRDDGSSRHAHDRGRGDYPVPDRAGEEGRYTARNGIRPWSCSGFTGTLSISSGSSCSRCCI